jgi:hypothetical protein
MEIRFAQSARKHRIGKARVNFVMENNSYTVISSQDSEKIQWVWIAKDDRGLELEIVAVVLEQYLLITHVMPTSLRRRKKNWQQK